MTRILDTNTAIIDAFGSRRRFGEACGFKRNPDARASDMRRRNSIPSRRWPRIVKAAALLGLPITVETLVAAEAKAQRAKLRQSSSATEPLPAVASSPESTHAAGGGR